MSPQTVVAISFAASIAASVGLVATYIAGGQPQIEGLLLGAALGGLGVGLVLWATDLVSERDAVEERHVGPSGGEVVVPGGSDPDDPGRRTVLVRLLGGAGAVLAGALAIPALSLGPRPRRSLFQTPWSDGDRVVDDRGQPIRPGDIPFESVRTVFPEGHIGSADGQALLLKVRPELLALDGRAAEWTVQGCVVYSKICTHAGCPVGLYRARAHELLCPCHQSTFDVLRGAVPVFGPAARPLPQLPLGVDSDGYLVALGDFPEPVGPSFWNMTS